MKVIIQRVSSASVSVDGAVVSSIGKGLCVLLGISSTDTKHDADYMVKKISSLRCFEDPSDPKKNWAKSVTDIKGDILMVSQFTLCHILKKNKPDFHNAMGGEEAKVIFDGIVDALTATCGGPDKVKKGVFGAYMNVSIQNDGPVTLTLDSADAPQPPKVFAPKDKKIRDTEEQQEVVSSMDPVESDVKP